MKEKIRVGYIGLGRRGFGMLKACFGAMNDVEIAYLCDLHETRIDHAVKECFTDLGKPAPAVTTDYREILRDESVDAVVIMTEWAGHAPIATEAALAGKYVAVEVGCAYSLQECFDLVAASEKTGAPVMMLENCCYGRREMMALRMVKEGLFGEIVHCVGGYHHYLPDCELFTKLEDPIRHYRIGDYEKRNCEQYPTHELGPIAKVLNINRGNRMLRLNSIASKAAGLRDYCREHLPADSEFNHKTYAQGDIITTVITCANGETISLVLDTTLPRAYYSRNFTVRGTKGMSTEERKVVFLEGMKEEIADNEAEFYEKYDHPLHKEYVSLGERGGHGGMDWLVCRAFVEAVKAGINTPIDVYDTAAWMCIAPLSEESIQKQGAPVEIPDFTHGAWQNREPSPVSKYSLNEIIEDPSVAIFPGEE